MPREAGKHFPSLEVAKASLEHPGIGEGVLPMAGGWYRVIEGPFPAKPVWDSMGSKLEVRTLRAGHGCGSPLLSEMQRIIYALKVLVRQELLCLHSSSLFRSSPVDIF